MRPLGWIVPTSDIPSGGHLYNQYLIAALQSMAPRLLYRWTWSDCMVALQQPGCPTDLVLDTLYLAAWQASADAFTGKRVWLLVHHLSSLEAGRFEAQLAAHRLHEAALLQGMHGFICTSPFTADYLRRLGYPADRCLVVPPALCISAAPQRHAPELKRVLMVANLVERKGIMPFLQALRDQIEALPFTLEIIGSPAIAPDYAAGVQDWLQKESVFAQQVLLSGALQGAALQKQYQAAQVFVSAAQMETYGMALQEAVAYRLPIIALDRGNVGFHLPSDQTGFLAGEMDELAEKVLALVEDKALLQKWQQAAWAFRPYESYDWPAAAALVAAFFKDAVA